MIQAKMPPRNPERFSLLALPGLRRTQPWLAGRPRRPTAFVPWIAYPPRKNNECGIGDMLYLREYHMRAIRCTR